MSPRVDVFVSTHHDALDRARQLDEGESSPSGTVSIAGITDYEIEQLGQLASRTVGAGGEAELYSVDASLDSLYVAPEEMVRALGELVEFKYDDGSPAISDVASQWATTEDIPFDESTAQDYVEAITDLATEAGGEEDLELYVWVEQA